MNDFENSEKRNNTPRKDRVNSIETGSVEERGKKEYVIPNTHPRYQSLHLREIISDSVENGITAPEGLIAHGRGEAFDYLLGELTTEPARSAINAAAAQLILAKNPVISVNGNVAALATEDIIKLGEVLPAKIEVNIFHYSKKRFTAILKRFADNGEKEILGENRDMVIPGLDHARALCTADGIYSADVVLVPLEDGDRAEALRKMGKSVITIDLNPLSRTARLCNITIVDNLVRALPELINHVEVLKQKDITMLEQIVGAFNNSNNLRSVLKLINERLDTMEFKPVISGEFN